jgi:hypothetical protein
MFLYIYNFVSSKVCLGVYKVQGTTKEEFVANVIQVEMQRCHLYTAYHVPRATNVTITYRAKHEIVNNDMV